MRCQEGLNLGIWDSSSKIPPGRELGVSRVGLETGSSAKSHMPRSGLSEPGGVSGSANCAPLPSPLLKPTDTRARTRARMGRGARGRDGPPPTPVLIKEKHAKVGGLWKKRAHRAAERRHRVLKSGRVLRKCRPRTEKRLDSARIRPWQAHAHCSLRPSCPQYGNQGPPWDCPQEWWATGDPPATSPEPRPAQSSSTEAPLTLTGYRIGATRPTRAL